jgi:hypothetical protein
VGVAAEVDTVAATVVAAALVIVSTLRTRPREGEAASVRQALRPGQERRVSCDLQRRGQRGLRVESVKGEGWCMWGGVGERVRVSI